MYRINFHKTKFYSYPNFVGAANFAPTLLTERINVLLHTVILAWDAWAQIKVLRVMH